MSWRAEFRQKLLQLRKLIAARAARTLAILLGTRRGLITMTLLLCVLTVAVFISARASLNASAQSNIRGGLVQIATRVPTHEPVIVPTVRPTRTPTPTSTATRQPTPTWTAQPTATPVAASPLSLPLVVASATDAVTTTLTLTESLALTLPVPLPLPIDRSGPQIVPVDVITFTPTADALSLLIPTATPTATPSIVEALEQPIEQPVEKPAVIGGLGGIAATATAAAPAIEQADDEPPVSEAAMADASVTEPGAIGATIPQPEPTIAAQPTPDGDVRTARVPILMYHYLSVPPPGADIYRQDLSVAPDLFAAHLDAMQQAGYTPITLYALLDNLTHGAPLPEKPVVLTFDDGYRDNYTNAFPLLRDRGMTATFFIVTDFIHDERPEYLTWDMVREMYAAGMSIEAHGRNHVSLANKDNDYLIWQALGTYESIEVEIGVRPRFISYPAGEYDQRTIDIFSSASYWAGFTTKQGATHRSDDLFQLRRIRVRGSTTTEELLRILALDW